MTGFLIEKAPKPIYRFVRDNHECIGCGKCCHCSPLVVTPKDIRVMACALHMNVKSFKKEYTERYPQHPQLSHFKKENPCGFLDENNRCKIYHARPDICRQYPNRPDRNIPGECQVTRDLLLEICDEKGNVTTHSMLIAQQRRLVRASLHKEEQCISPPS